MFRFRKKNSPDCVPSQRTYAVAMKCGMVGFPELGDFMY